MFRTYKNVRYDLSVCFLAVPIICHYQGDVSLSVYKYRVSIIVSCVSCVKAVLWRCAPRDRPPFVCYNVISATRTRSWFITSSRLFSALSPPHPATSWSYSIQLAYPFPNPVGKVTGPKYSLFYTHKFVSVINTELPDLPSSLISLFLPYFAFPFMSFRLYVVLSSVFSLSFTVFGAGVAQYSVWLRARGLRFGSRQRQRIFPLASASGPALGPP
jgi:hypothetical protein